MSHHRILRRRDYDQEISALPLGVQRKAEWATLQLGARGRTPSTKSTVGLNMRWRRSPVQGSHYYLWWIPASDTGIELNGAAEDPTQTILVHSVRHHDETSRAIEIGRIDEYTPVELGLLDPRFDEQSEVAHFVDRDAVSFASIEGMPGSGKSVALLFLARDLALRSGIQKIRYITYSDRLKREAREIFDSLDDAIADHIVVSTFGEVVRDLLKLPRSSAFGQSEQIDQRAFIAELDRLGAAQLGRWRGFPETLYTELRGYVIGRSLPRGYNIPKHKHELLRRSGDQIDIADYARKRKFDERTAQIAVAQGERQRERFFTDQALAFNALETLMRGQAPHWLFNTDAIIIDEVQDLTLLQIALIGEMASARRARHPERPFVLTIAGDESQIVQPTGFQWGVTKNLLGERLNVHPQRVGFLSQRRSPLAIARLMDKSWDLYSALPRELRPSAQKATTVLEEGGESEEAGVVGFIDMPATQTGDAQESAEWRDLLTALTSRPGRALIDLEHALEPHRAVIESVESADEVIFDPREIKGLERATVIVAGMNALHARILVLLEEKGRDRVAELEARRLIDHLRVALSRSTNRLIFLEERTAPVFQSLGLEDGLSALELDLQGLIALLDADEMTEVEMVEGMLDEAVDLADRDRSEDARHRNRRAAELAEQLRIPSLIRRAADDYAEFLIADAERALDAGDVAMASKYLVEAGDTVDESLLATRFEHYRVLQQRIAAASQDQFLRLVEESERYIAAEQWMDALTSAQAAFELARGDEGDLRRQQAGELLAQAALRNVLYLAQTDAGENLHDAIEFVLESVRPAVEFAGGERPLEFAYLVAGYREGKDIASFRRDLGLAGGALNQQDGWFNAPLSGEMAAIVIHWLDSSHRDMGDAVDLFCLWGETALDAAARIGYAGLDDKIWDLENRWLLRREMPDAPQDDGHFEAFLAAYNGDHAQASTLWEEIGDLARAIQASRAAGDFERTSALYRKMNKPAPDTLSKAIKFVRQAAQIQHNHAGLTEAERRTLLEELARLHTELSLAESNSDEGEE